MTVSRCYIFTLDNFYVISGLVMFDSESSRVAAVGTRVFVSLSPIRCPAFTCERQKSINNLSVIKLVLKNGKSVEYEKK